MKKLLKELQKLDTDCYDEIWAWALWLADPEYGDYDENDPGYLKHRDDVIVGCVGRAIAALAWIWTLSLEDSQSDCALAGTPYEAIIFNDQIDILVEEIYGDSPAKAILTAYLEAIRSQPCQT